MTSWRPEERVVPLVHQRWEDVAFVHHAYPPGVIADLLPAGLEPDTFGGTAWVGITPFRLHSGVVPFLPRPRATVGELNVRTYVRDASGRDGIWFLTLELDHLPAALGIRTLLRVPYRWAEVAVEPGDGLTYRSRRHRPHASARAHLRVRPGAALGDPEPPPFETFLAARWRAYTRIGGRLFTVPVEHEPWPVHRAELLAIDETLLTSVGLPAPQDDPHVMWSPGVDVRIGLPRRVVSPRP